MQLFTLIESAITFQKEFTGKRIINAGEPVQASSDRKMKSNYLSYKCDLCEFGYVDTADNIDPYPFTDQRKYFRLAVHIMILI